LTKKIESLVWARTQHRDSRKHRPGFLFSKVKLTGFPQGEAGEFFPRPIPWKDQRLVVSRSAVLPPRPSPALELLNFRKSWGIFYKALDINPRIDIISKQF
jgi:hypothetical protein